MNTLDNQLLDDLADLPGWDELTSTPAPTPAPESLARSTTAVREAIAAEASRAMNADLIRGGTRPTTTPRRHRARWIVAAVAGVAAAAVLVAAPTISTPGNQPVSVASASEFLTHLAATTPAAADLEAAYWKVTSNSVNLANPAPGSDRAQTTTVWYGRSGGEWIQTAGDTVRKVSKGPATFTLPYDAALTWTQVTELSSDPVALEADLKSILGTKGSIVDAVGMLLGTAPLTTTQRAAMFTILSTQPDVTMRKGIKDETGRTGTSLDFPFGPTETLSLLLTDDGTLLQVTAVASVDHEKALDSPRIVGSAPSPAPTEITKKGTVLSRETYLEIGGTDTAPGK